MKKKTIRDNISYSEKELFDMLVKRNYHVLTQYTPLDIVKWFNENKKKEEDEKL